MARRTKKATNFRASWKGQLRVGLVAFGVQAVNSQAKEESDIHFHQLHETCHSRIQYKKVCPIHGEVSHDEIVMGYEYGRGKYIEVEEEELDSLQTEHEKALTVDAFIKPEQLDPIYFDGRLYYLLPAGSEAGEPYRLLHEAMEQQERWGIGQVVFSGKDQLVALRSVGPLLAMVMLKYSAELRDPAELKPASVHGKTAPRKLRLAEDLVKSWSEARLDLDKYEDRYRDRVEHLLEAKAAGREVVAPDEGEAPPVINLMEALKQSVAKTGSHRKSAAKSHRSSGARPRKRAKARHKRAS